MYGGDPLHSSSLHYSQADTSSPTATTSVAAGDDYTKLRPLTWADAQGTIIEAPPPSLEMATGFLRVIDYEKWSQGSSNGGFFPWSLAW